MKNIYSVFTLLCFFLSQLLLAQETNSTLRGVLKDIENDPISNATIFIDGSQIQETTKQDGSFEIKNLSEGTHKITFLSDNYNQYTETVSIGVNETKDVRMTMYRKGDIEHIEVVGGNKVPDGLDAITRVPLKPNEMIQTISVIPDVIIKEQGALSLTDVTQNVPGVTLFGSYGGVRESMSIRGYRGTPVLKNGVQVDSDFRTASLASDMQGVESVQVLKGSAALTQGIGDGLGSPGGVINVVTKTPKFTNEGNFSIRTGSWGLFRPTLDYQTVLDKKQTVAFRINTAYERADSYKSFVRKEKFYVNPSLEWRPDDKTRIILEMDYLNADTTPDIGTINLAADDTEALFEMPHNKFLGFKSDNVHNQTTTYSARVYRKLTDKLTLRGTYAASSYQVESNTTSLGKVRQNGQMVYNLRTRSLGKSERDDKNSVVQIDLIGKDLQTGFMKHTFQAGFDYKKTDLTTLSYSSIAVDQIDIFSTIPNFLPEGISSSFVAGDPSKSNSSMYGFTAQDIITFNQYLKAMLGVRYSSQTSESNSTIGKVTGDAWDPFFGIMVNPTKNINIFGSYTTTSSLRSATNRDINGKEMGPSVSNQWEFGFKSAWFKERLFFNATYFNIKNSDLQYGITDGTNSTVLYYILAGDLKRSGVELELTGKILPNLKVIAGYSYLDSRYEDSPSYVDGSRPMNAPRNTANGWVQYLFDKGTLKNLSVGVGIYYVGSRPVNEWSLVADNHGTVPGTKPFLMPDYTTVNAQLGYNYKNIGLRVFFNNIFDAVGYNSYYRGGYINQIDPRNFGAQLSYNF